MAVLKIPNPINNVGLIESFIKICPNPPASATIDFDGVDDYLDSELNISNFKNKFETFADKHFKSAIKDFENEIQHLKNKSPHELIKLERISSELQHYYNQLINHKIFDSELLLKLREKAKESLSKI